MMLELHEIVTILIACLALIVTVSNAIAQRRHYRLSVKPLLIVRSSIRYKGDSDFYGVQIKNNGLGPAEIVSTELYLDDKLLPFTLSHWNKALKEIGLEADKWFFLRLLPGTAIRNGHDEWLIRTKEPVIDANAVIKAFNRLRIKIIYQSVYGDLVKPVDRLLVPAEAMIEVEGEVKDQPCLDL